VRRERVLPRALPRMERVLERRSGPFLRGHPRRPSRRIGRPALRGGRTPYFGATASWASPEVCG